MFPTRGTEQYFATRDFMYYPLQMKLTGPVCWWIRRNRQANVEGAFHGYAADVPFAGDTINGYVLRSELYKECGGGELKVAHHGR